MSPDDLSGLYPELPAELTGVTEEILQVMHRAVEDAYRKGTATTIRHIARLLTVFEQDLAAALVLSAGQHVLDGLDELIAERRG